jgi:hypothetical protein
MVVRRARCLCLIDKTVTVYAAADEDEALVFFIGGHFAMEHPDETGKLGAEGLKIAAAVREGRMTEAQAKNEGWRMMRSYAHISFESGPVPRRPRATIAMVKEQNRQLAARRPKLGQPQHHHPHLHTPHSH